MAQNAYKAKRGTLKSRAQGLGAEIGFGFQQWGEELDKLFSALGERPVDVIQVFQSLVTQLFANIQIATPVDTGQARASWRIELTVDEGKEYRYVIFNGVPYIIFLELGSSKQAPKGMVRVNVDKFIRDTRTGTARILKSNS